MLADGESFTVGTPLVADTPIWTTVLEHFKGEKVTIFNYSPKKRIRVKIGHRQNYTRLLVEQIGGSEFVKKEPVKVEKAVEVKAEEAEMIEKPAKPSSKEKVEPKAAAASPKTRKPAAKAAAAKKPAAKTAAKAAPKAKKPAASPEKKTTKTASKKPAEK
jgi:hypothetical protein